ncbi:hypothetical protein PR048_032133 [Dryococelus australis]|uniref:Uncharacterized protein n=1 Tax=Dryococelus australis TaxID=614101 RepID=A0ABQ9G1C7_9NEOP|nr:hypothetical protein PR048_032133 [Dryococelus australis]
MGLLSANTEYRPSPCLLQLRDPPLVHTVFDTSWIRLAESTPSTVTANNQCPVDIAQLITKDAVGLHGCEAISDIVDIKEDHAPRLKKSLRIFSQIETRIRVKNKSCNVLSNHAAVAERRDEIVACITNSSSKMASPASNMAGRPRLLESSLPDDSTTNKKYSMTSSRVPDFRKWESCGTMPLVGGFSRGCPVSPAPLLRRCSIFTSIILIGSQDLAVKHRPNLFTHVSSLLHTRLVCAAVDYLVRCGCKVMRSALREFVTGGCYTLYRLRGRVSHTAKDRETRPGRGGGWRPNFESVSLHLITFDYEKLRRLSRIRLGRASQKQSSDSHKTPYDRVKRCRERKINIKASERVNVDGLWRHVVGSLLQLGRDVHYVDRQINPPLSEAPCTRSIWPLYRLFPDIRKPVSVGSADTYWQLTFFVFSFFRFYWGIRRPNRATDPIREVCKHLSGYRPTLLPLDKAKGNKVLVPSLLRGTVVVSEQVSLNNCKSAIQYGATPRLEGNSKKSSINSVKVTSLHDEVA